MHSKYKWETQRYYVGLVYKSKDTDKHIYTVQSNASSQMGQRLDWG
jgi:hypothetical protein